MLLKNKYEGSIESRIKNVTLDEDSEELIIEGYANTTTKDRAGDIIPRSAWESPEAMGNYSKNPIILAYHNHGNPIGKMIDYFVDDKGLNIKAKISKGAGQVYQLIKDGILTTFSVGFMIKDAEYLSKTDTYMINELELLEVSVVSVPCNQDSTFSVSKSLKDSEAFKQELLPSQKADNKDSKDKDTEKMTIKTEENSNPLTLEAIEKLLADKEAAKEAEAKRLADEKAAKEAQAKEMQTAAKEAAEGLVKDLETKMAESAESFAKALKEKESELETLHEEIKQITAQRSKNFSYNKVQGSMVDQEARKNANDAVLLGILTEKGTFGTKFGEQIKAVNTSSSIEVSSEAYETVFSTDLIRDIQAELVVAPLFRDITMTAANLTIPVNPDRKNASWVSGSAYGTDNSSGSELTAALTEITLKTMKLAAKSYITDETSEDAIIPLLPLIRMHLVEAHANEIDRAFLLGTGSGEPLGLVPRATAAEGSADSAGKAGGVETSAATHTGTEAITAKMILKARKKMKLYGLNVRDVSLVVSTECYYALIEDEAWADVNLVGGAATKLTGQVGSIYGMPVLVSDHFAAPSADAAYAVLVNTKNFLVPTQRSVTVRTDFDVEKDRRVIVATQRLNLESLIRDTDGKDKGVVAVTYASA